MINILFVLYNIKCILYYRLGIINCNNSGTTAEYTYYTYFDFDVSIFSKKLSTQQFEIKNRKKKMFGTTVYIQSIYMH